MWNVKCVIIPVVTGVIRTVTNGLKKNLEAVPGKHSIDSLKNTAIVGTSNIKQKVLKSET
jgi:hypothetical protein